MSELQFPSAPPLSREVRERALRTVLSGMDASPRRRAVPLVAAAAVVVMVLGAAGTVALLRSAHSGVEVATVPTATDPGVTAMSMLPDPAHAPPPSGAVDPAVTPDDPDRQLGGGTSGNGTFGSLDRCRAAAVSSERAAEFPPAAAWFESDDIPQLGTDDLIMINQSFLCLASPATVSMSPQRGTRVGAVEIVRLSDDWLGVLNPDRASVSWRIGDLDSKPSTAPVLGLYLEGGVAPSAVTLTVTGARGGDTEISPVPEPEPEATAIVVTDRPLPTRDSASPDGADLDRCIRRNPPDPTREFLNPQVAEDSEPLLWQPLARVELPDGGFAISAAIGNHEDSGADDTPFYAGICIGNADGTVRYWAGQRQPRATADFPVADVMGGEGAKVFAVAPGVATVRVTSGDTRRACEQRGHLALCPDLGPGLQTYTLFGVDGSIREFPSGG